MPIQLTADGSHTIHSDKYDVAYHSIHGALKETNHVFIDAGLRFKKATLTDIRILEVGFGTGLNVLATIADNKAGSYELDFHTIEAYPITSEEVNQLNYHEHIDAIGKDEIIHLHNLPWDKKSTIHDRFTFTKHLRRLESFESDLKFDIIYFDAFAPTAQPELWETSILFKMYNLLNHNGILVTYCAKGQFKRDLKSVGFEVQSIPGPPRKREMTRAIKSL